MRVFKYDKKKNSLAIQSLIMIIIAAAMFYTYRESKQIIYLVLLAFSMAFVGIYFYRMFVMRVIFENNRVTYKGLVRQYTIYRNEIYDIKLLSQVGREVRSVKYIKGGDYSNVNNKTYLLIRKSKDVEQVNLSMFNAATEDYISLEYVQGIEIYLDKLLEDE